MAVVVTCRGIALSEILYMLKMLYVYDNTVIQAKYNTNGYSREIQTAKHATIFLHMYLIS